MGWTQGTKVAHFDPMTPADTATTDPARIAQPVGDPLGEILHLLKLTGTFYCQARLTAPWGIDVPAFPGVMTFAVISQGQCWLTISGHAAVHLNQGDLLLLTGGAAHALRSTPDARTVALQDLPVEPITEIYERLDFGGGGAVVQMTYGVMRIDHAAGGMLMGLLPDVLKIDAWRDEAGGWLQGTLQFIAREAQALRPGGETVITRLADVVVVEAIRRWIATAPEANRGWLKAARDPQIGRAIMAIHRAPAQDWTVEALAETAGMSRSAFAARFGALIGMPAMGYLTHWRMQLAHEALTTTTRPHAAIAADLGYGSEAAFARAFKRVVGQTPGQIRRTAHGAGN